MRNILNLLILSLLAASLLSCDPSEIQAGLDQQLEQGSGSDSASADLNKLTNNGTTFPSSGALNSHIDNSLSSPTNGHCSNPPSDNPKMDPASLNGKGACDIAGTDDKWRKNCEKMLKSNKVPKDAFLYALRMLKNNSSEFKNKKCYKFSARGDGGSHADFKKAMAKGIPNKCQMIINNLKEEAPSPHQKPFRRKMYYIDICKNKVTTTYFNLGTGTFKGNKSGKSYNDRNGERSTLKGAFLTNTKLFNFVPGPKSRPAYNELRKRMKKKHGVHKAHSVQLVGLQKTNQGAMLDGKHMHVSPYKSSWGCPSIHEDNYWMIDEVTKNGPSLVLNYGDGMPDVDDANSCSSRK